MRALAVLALLVAGCAAPQLDDADVCGDCPSFTIAFDGVEVPERVLEFDPRDRPTAAAYADNGSTHPEFYSVHDATWAWAQATGTDVTMTFFSGGFGDGFFLERVEGAPAAGENAFWQLRVNGTASDQGMSDVRVVDGMHIDWVLTTF